MLDLNLKKYLKLVEIVKKNFENHDSSHDFLHVERVINISLKIAKSEKEKFNLNEKDFEIIQIAALLHDLNDEKLKKYQNDSSITFENLLKKFNFEDNLIKSVIFIINNISFRVEISLNNNKNKNNNKEDKIDQKLINLLHIVQDSDRLDAIGSIGIARTFVYCGSSNGKIFSKDIKEHELNLNLNYDKKSNITIKHFYEKLFKIKNLIKTETGKKMAKKRHKQMKKFIKQFFNEWKDSFPDF